MAAHRVRPEISRTLGHLRGLIRRYVLLEGTASVLVLLGLLFWFSLGLDWSYFRLERAELPLWIRFLVGVTGLSLLACAAVVWVGLRYFRGFRARALALILERRFPELNDRLITAIELAETPDHEPPLTTAMIGRTADEVATITARLKLAQVFDMRPLLRAGLSALCLAISIGMFAVAFDDVFHLWFRRNVLLANDTWKRETELKVHVVAEPGERLVAFKNGVYKHPRGGDLTILADVLPDKKVPEQVQFRYRALDGSASGRAYFSRLGESQFKHTLAGVIGSLEFTLLAGDAERRKYVIEVVDPPRIDRIVLHNLYPAYTGLNETNAQTQQPERSEKPVQGTQVSLPAGSDFILQAVSNKPLVGVRIQTDAYDVTFSKDAATLTLFEQDGDNRHGGAFPIPQSSPWLAADGQSFSVPFVLAGAARQEAVSEQGAVHLPLRLPPDALFRIYLTDADDIYGSEPARLTINSILDEPPRVETLLRGIGTSITRKATIPVSGLITDDYGVAAARFDYKVDAGETFQPRPFAKALDGSREFPLQMSETQPYERFEVLPLELKVGQKLVLAVFAADGDDLHGPHSTQGERYAFQVVSDEELLSTLYARELNLRHRFEQILEEIKGTRGDLVLHRKRLEEQRQLQALPAQDQQAKEVRERLDAIEIAVTAAAERALHGVRKNHNETEAIEQSFGDIREEMINNAVDSPQSLERIDEKLVKPLHAINTIDYNDVDQALGLFRLAFQDKTDALPRVDETLGHVERLIAHMEAVLFEMRRLETFKEAIELLKAIKNQQDELKRRTEAERKRKLIEGLE